MLQICSMNPMTNDSGQQRYEEAFDNPCDPQFPCPFCSTQASEEDTMTDRTKEAWKNLCTSPFQCSLSTSCRKDKVLYLNQLCTPYKCSASQWPSTPVLGEDPH